MSMPPDEMQNELTGVGDYINMQSELQQEKMKAWSPMFSKKFEEALYMIELAGGLEDEDGISTLQQKGWLEND